MDRREALRTLSLSTLAAGFSLTGCKISPEGTAKDHEFWNHVTEKDLEKWNTQFFTDHEYEAVRQLANMIIPADDRSGNAQYAGVPQFIDFMMLDRPDNQTPIRGGLNWLDFQCQKRYNKNFIVCTEVEKTEILDEIAYPEEAKPEMQQGVTFFNRFRDLVASGFWSSKVGIEDIGYRGNQPYDWQGCSHEALEHLGMGDKAKTPKS